jgi:predicted RND superfamily exporter protein
MTNIWKVFLHRPKLALTLALILLVVCSVITANKLEPNNAAKVYLPSSSEVVRFQEDVLYKHFQKETVTVLLFENERILSQDFLDKIDLLSTELKNSDLVSKLYSITTVDHIESDEQGFAIDPLINVNEFGSRPKAYWGNRIRNDKFAEEKIISSDLTKTTVTIFPKYNDNTEQLIKLEEIILKAVNENDLSQSLIGLAGLLPLDTAQFRTALNDNMIFTPLIILIGFALIYFLFRSYLLIALFSLCTSITLSISFALMAILEMPYTSVSGIIGPLLSSLTTALLLHLFSAINLAGKKGLTPLEQVSRGFSDFSKPALYIVMTTAGGVLSLSFSPVPAVAEFGWIAAAGVMVSYIVAMTILPGTLLYWAKNRSSKTEGLQKNFDKLLVIITRISLRHPVKVISVVSLISLFFILQIFNIKVETSFLDFFKKDHPVIQSTRALEKDFFGSSTGVVAFSAEELDRFKDPSFLKKVKDVQHWLDRQETVDTTTSVSDFVEEMHKAFHSGNPDFEKIPDSRALIEQYLFIYSGTDIYDVVNRDFNVTQVTFNTRSYGANEGQEFLDRLNKKMNTIDWEGVEWSLNGYLKILSDQEELLVKGQVRSLWIALLMMFIFMLFLTRSFRDASICMIPNLAPPIIVFGLMGLTGILLNIGTALVASVVIGIAVDDTIHMFHSIKKRKENGAKTVWALAKSIRETGRAIVATTLIIGLQFFILVFSEFVPILQFGVLALTGVIAALIFDLFFLPSLLVLLYKD